MAGLLAAASGRAPAASAWPRWTIAWTASPASGSCAFEAGKDGKVEIAAPWPGLYIVKTSWKDRTPGEFKGRIRGMASPAATLSFMKP